MSENEQDVGQEETITFADFKSWLVVMIRNKGGAVPDIEDWKEIKVMMDKVSVLDVPPVFVGWDLGRDDGCCRSPSFAPVQLDSKHVGDYGYAGSIPNQKFIETRVEPHSFSYGPITIAGDPSREVLTPLPVKDQTIDNMIDIIHSWIEDDGNQKEKI